MYIGILIPDTKHHITIAYNGRGEDRETYGLAVTAVARVAERRYERKERALRLHLQATDCFERGAHSTWYAKVKSKKLMEFREELVEEMKALGLHFREDFDSYIPHITLSHYRRKPRNPYDGLTLLVDRVTVVSDTFGNTSLRI